VKISEFKNGEMNGKTTILSENNDYYFEGEFLDNKKSGFGNLIKRNKFNYSGKFLNGYFDGSGILIDY